MSKFPFVVYGELFFIGNEFRKDSFPKANVTKKMLSGK